MKNIEEQASKLNYVLNESFDAQHEVVDHYLLLLAFDNLTKLNFITQCNFDIAFGMRDWYENNKKLYDVKTKLPDVLRGLKIGLELVAPLIMETESFEIAKIAKKKYKYFDTLCARIKYRNKAIIRIFDFEEKLNIHEDKSYRLRLDCSGPDFDIKLIEVKEGEGDEINE